MWAVPAAVVGVLLLLLSVAGWKINRLESNLRGAAVEASIANDVARANEEEVRRLLRKQEQALKALKKQKDAALAARRDAEGKLKKALEAKDAQEPASAAIAPLLMR